MKSRFLFLLLLLAALPASAQVGPFGPKLYTDPFVPVDSLPTRLIFNTWCQVGPAALPRVEQVGNIYWVIPDYSAGWGCVASYPPPEDAPFAVDLGLVPAGIYTVKLRGPHIATFQLVVAAAPRLSAAPARPAENTPTDLLLSGVVGRCPSARLARSWDDVLEVELSLGGCGGPPEAHDLEVPLGALAAGKYQVQVIGDLALPPFPLEVLPRRARLGGGRFEVAAGWQNAAGESGEALLAQAPSNDSALYYFFDESNWELQVKVLDGCAVNGHYWVFAAAASDVGIEATVTDLEENRTFRFANPLGHPAAAATSIDAFPCN